MKKEVLNMSTDGDNIVRGRIRRWAAIHGRVINPCGPAKSEKPAIEKCSYCDGSKRKFVVDRVVQGQDYGPETEGHYESCPYCT